MPRFLRLLAFALALSGLVISSQAQTRDPSSLPLPENLFPDLKGILEAAANQSPRMIARNAENSIAEQNRLIARSGLLPSVGASLQFNPWQRDNRSDLAQPTDTKKFYYNLSLTQPLFHWGALRNGSRIGELQEKIVQGQTAEAYRLLAQEIRAQYLGLILRKVILSRAQLNLSITADLLAAAQGKFEKQVISEGEMFMPRLNHDQAVLAVDRNTEEFESAKTAFAKLTGAPRLNDAQIPADIPSVTTASDALASILADYTSHKELKSFYLDTLRNQIAVEELNYKVATTRLKPKLNLIVGASQDQLSYTSNIAAKYKVQSTYLGVSVYWPIFDGFATRSVVANSLTRRRQAEQVYADAVANLSEQTRSQLKQLSFSARSLEMANRMLGSGESYVQSRQDDVKRGLASEAQLNAVRLLYLDAKIAAFNARFDYLIKTGDFLSLLLEDPALVNLTGRTP
jgi:outer membrane protein TolC